MQQLPKNFRVDEKHVISMQDMHSMECYQYADGTEQQVLRGVDMNVARSDRVSIVGEEPFALQLLMEIIGNIKPYESGKCSLVGLGMMRVKRRVLSHVYYVNSQKLLYYHMQGISWLMFASRRVMKNDVDRQIFWLERLLELGLSRLCFTFIRHMTDAEKMIILLLLTLKIDVSLILADFSQVIVEEALFPAISSLFQALSKAGKAVVFSTTQTGFAQACSEKAAFLIDGALHVQGDIDELCRIYDRRAYQLRFSNTENLRDAQTVLGDYFSHMRTSSDGEMSLYRGDGQAPVAAELMRILNDKGIVPEQFIASKPSLEEAFQAAVRKENDL